MIRAIVAALFYFGLWLLWSGHTEPLLIGMGIGSSALVALLGHRLRVIDSEAYPFHLLPALSTFVPWLLWEIVKANIHVARIILSPRLPIRPHLLRVKASQKTVFGQVMHANTITITPGTLSLDVRDGTILVHALTDAAASEDASGSIDARLLRVERGAL